MLRFQKIPNKVQEDFLDEKEKYKNNIINYISPKKKGVKTE